MSTPFITWAVIVAVAAAAIVFNLVRAVAGRLAHHHGRHHFISLGSEREEFFIPGDVLKPDNNDYYDSDEI